MLFNSLSFLIFFPIVTALVFILPSKARIPWLLAASCYFYAAFIPKFLIILFVLILIDFYAALWIERTTGLNRKFALYVSLVANISLLALFKYYGFFTENLAVLARAFSIPVSFPVLSLVLPLGLSFHTFQSMAYTIEVYRGRSAERSLPIYALYVLFYPQLVAGPIERPNQLLPQLHQPIRFSAANLGAGLELMCWGFFKKMFVADRLALYVNDAFGQDGAPPVKGFAMLMGVYCFAWQIYFDFSGYTDIARGAARVMGIELMRNFDRPYGAESIPDFWRRWHISLSTWFRDYLYIPLGGGRVSKPLAVRNIMIVFLVSGLWHGANWTFVAWGALHGVFMSASILSREFLPEPRRAFRRWRVFVTFQLVCFTWIFFRAANLNQALQVIANIAHPADFAPRASLEFLFFDVRLHTCILALALYFALNALHSRLLRTANAILLRPIWSVALILTILMGAPLSETTFIYFQF